jgi:hypothetical protein
MCYVVGMLEGLWLARLVSVTYSPNRFRRSFFATTWYHSFFPMQLGGKTLCVKVEVVDAPLDYILLLGRSWTYSMQFVVSTVFWVLLFPHEGQIVTIDQLSFSRPDPALGESTVPMIDNPQLGVVNVGVGLCPYLMGTFDYLPSQGDIKFISNHHKVEIFQVLSFRTTYFDDLWIFPSPSATMDGIGNLGMSMALSVAEVVYSLVQQTSTHTDPTPAQEFNPFLEPIWAQGSLTDTDSLDLLFTSDEAVIEAMTSPYKPWDDLHHRSYFLPELSRIEAREFTLTMTGDRSCPINPLATHEIYAEGNMTTITKMIPINISITPDIIDNVFVGAYYSPKEMQDIDPQKVNHELTLFFFKLPLRSKSNIQ